MRGHVSDHSLSGHSHTCTFSSSEVSLSFPSSCPLFFFLVPLCLISFSKYSLSRFSPFLVSFQTLDNYPIPNNNNNQWQGRPVSEWNNQQVCLWLIAMNMDQYTSDFAAKGVDGTQLLNMDSQKLKVSKYSWSNIDLKVGNIISVINYNGNWYSSPHIVLLYHMNIFPHRSELNTT